MADFVVVLVVAAFVVAAVAVVAVWCRQIRQGIKV